MIARYCEEQGPGQGEQIHISYLPYIHTFLHHQNLSPPPDDKVDTLTFYMAMIKILTSSLQMTSIFIGWFNIDIIQNPNEEQPSLKLKTLPIRLIWRWNTKSQVQPTSFLNLTCTFDEINVVYLHLMMMMNIRLPIQRLPQTTHPMGYYFPLRICRLMLHLSISWVNTCS